MARYAYPLPRRYRRCRRGGTSPAAAAVAGAVVLTVAAHAHAAAGHPGTQPGSGSHHAAVPANPAAAKVIAFARAQLGKPYLWGGTGPGAFDCSGLAMDAYASAGIGIQRTSQDQWASERHVASPEEGDLVFFAGADGTLSSPGHVGIVTDPARHQMIDAYASGTYVRYDTYGQASSAPGLTDPVGFTDPGGA